MNPFGSQQGNSVIALCLILATAGSAAIYRLNEGALQEQRSSNVRDARVAVRDQNLSAAIYAKTLMETKDTSSALYYTPSLFPVAYFSDYFSNTPALEDTGFQASWGSLNLNVPGCSNGDGSRCVPYSDSIWAKTAEAFTIKTLRAKPAPELRNSVDSIYANKYASSWLGDESWSTISNISLLPKNASIRTQARITVRTAVRKLGILSSIGGNMDQTFTVKLNKLANPLAATKVTLNDGTVVTEINADEPFYINVLAAGITPKAIVQTPTLATPAGCDLIQSYSGSKPAGQSTWTANKFRKTTSSTDKNSWNTVWRCKYDPLNTTAQADINTPWDGTDQRPNPFITYPVKYKVAGVNVTDSSQCQPPATRGADGLCSDYNYDPTVDNVNIVKMPNCRINIGTYRPEFGNNCAKKYRGFNRIFGEWLVNASGGDDESGCNANAYRAKAFIQAYGAVYDPRDGGVGAKIYVWKYNRATASFDRRTDLDFNPTEVFDGEEGSNYTGTQKSDRLIRSDPMPTVNSIWGKFKEFKPADAPSYTYRGDATKGWLTIAADIPITNYGEYLLQGAVFGPGGESTCGINGQANSQIDEPIDSWISTGYAYFRIWQRAELKDVAVSNTQSLSGAVAAEYKDQLGLTFKARFHESCRVLYRNMDPLGDYAVVPNCDFSNLPRNESEEMDVWQSYSCNLHSNTPYDIQYRVECENPVSHNASWNGGNTWAPTAANTDTIRRYCWGAGGPTNNSNYTISEQSAQDCAENIAEDSAPQCGGGDCAMYARYGKVWCKQVAAGTLFIQPDSGSDTVLHDVPGHPTVKVKDFSISMQNCGCGAMPVNCPAIGSYGTNYFKWIKGTKRKWSDVNFESDDDDD